MTKTLTALIFDTESPTTIGGLTLTERAVLLTHRAGLSPVRIWGSRTLTTDAAARLRSRGISVIQLPPDSAPLEGVEDDEGVVIVGSNVLFEPAALADLAGSKEHEGDAAAAYHAGVPLILYAPPEAIANLRECWTIEAMAASLARGGIVHEPRAGVFCRRVDPGDPVPSVGRDYIRHLNGGASESFFTKNIRRFSVPLTSWLVRLGARPTHVTLGGLGLAVASAWCLAQGSYAAGLLGGILYYTSMILDCSDGEVARLTARDSRFGAWLETMVDYLTYFLVLAALTVASQDLPGARTHLVAATVAVMGSIVVAVVEGYLRHRVAAADPGQFDEASAQAMASATPFHQFARWGRQWIKRSTVAHLIVVLALINQLPLLLYLWAFGATVASFVILAVEPFVARRVSVAPAGIRHVSARR
jgi:phosphatidylglycerophosphate synthase